MGSKEAFVSLVTPLVQKLAGRDLGDAKALRAQLERELPLRDALVASVRAAAEEGMREGWLLPKENAGIKFGRVAKDVLGFSIDAVWMQGPGPKHRHPDGEIDLCFALDGEPRFDGNPQGWTVYGPDSTHVPTVRGGTMLILYFLPGGKIEFVTG